MQGVTRTLTRIYMLLIIALGRTPVITLLELLQRPSVARVAIVRRRQLEYAAFFSADDIDGRAAAPIAGLDERPVDNSLATPPERVYIPVRTA